MATQEAAAQGEKRTSVWDEKSLYVRKWLPREEPRAMMYLCHGVGEHMGRYELLGEHLAENGILMFGHDHVGHGESEGDRVHVETFDTYIDDVIRHVEDMKREHPSLPCLLMGHSMGGLVALHVARQKPDLFTGLVSSSASVEAAVSGLTIFLGRALAVLLPQAGVRALDVNLISSIPEEVQMYAEDPLVYHGKLKAKWATAFIDSISVIREHLDALKLPVVLIHGTDDGIVPISSSETIFDNVSSEDKSFERFEGSRHEVLHDVEQERARKFLKDWILNHLSLPEPKPPSQEEPQPPAQEEPQIPAQEEPQTPAQEESQSPAPEEP